MDHFVDRRSKSLWMDVLERTLLSAPSGLVHITRRD
jgi:hypothetical protein